MKTKKNKDAEEALILDEGRVQECFGEDVVVRAQRGMHNVSGLVRVEDGGVLATVLGGGEQVTYVGIGKDGGIMSECTCVAGCDCVHAATLALVWGDCVRRERAIPPIDPTDDRLRRLDGEEPPKGSPLYADVEAQKALAYVEGLDASERYYLLLEYMEKNPRFLKEITLRAVVSECTDKELISTTKKEIKAVCASTGSVQEVDFIMVEYCLKHIVERELYDSLAGIGELLVKDVTRLLRRYFLQDAGIYKQVCPCLALCMEGVEKSSMSEGKRLEWDFRIRKMGKKSLFDEFPSKWDKPEQVSREAWAYVAELWAPIFRGKKAAPYEISVPDYQKAVMYSKSEEERIQDRLKAVDKVGDYAEVAKLLLDAGRVETAEEVCRKGIMRLGREPKAESLVKLLMGMYDTRGEERMSLAIAVEWFLRVGTYDAYQSAQEVAGKEGLLEPVEKLLKSALQVGKCPTKLRKLLPDSGFLEEKMSLGVVQRYELLFTIALEEDDEKALGEVWSKMKALGITLDKLSEETQEEVEEYFPKDVIQDLYERLQEVARKGKAEKVYDYAVRILELACGNEIDTWQERLEEWMLDSSLKPRVRSAIEDALDDFY